MRVGTGASLTLITVGLMVGILFGRSYTWQTTLSPTEDVVIEKAGLTFHARLDTGAVVSSINAHEIEVIGGSGTPSRKDVGRQIRFVLVNAANERQAVTAEIAQVRGIRMADCREVRYHVYLTVRFRGRTQRILTNLNDRSRSGEKLLLGRNWLLQGFAVGPVTEAEI